MHDELTQDDLERLSAYLDGELDLADARQVRHHIESEAAWRDAAAELNALDETLDEYTAPRCPKGLSDRIIVATRQAHFQRTLLMRVVKIVAPMAAAAAVLAVIAMAYPWGQQPVGGNGPVVKVTPAQVDEFVVDNLDFFKDYAAVETMAKNEDILDSSTLLAIEQLESQGGGKS